MATPNKITWNDFEKITKESIKRHSDLTVASYGKVANYLKDAKGVARPFLSKSLVDLEGVFMGGHQFIFDCKVITESQSFPVLPYYQKKKYKRQLDHLMTRSAFGVVSGFFIHFNRRELAKVWHDAITYFLPVHPGLPLWREMNEKQGGYINRYDMYEHAVPVEWSVPPRCQKLYPQIGQVLWHLKDSGTFDVDGGIYELEENPEGLSDEAPERPEDN